MIGGLAKGSEDLYNFTSTVAYYHDDLTWCVNKAKAIPIYFNIFYYVKDYELIIFGIFILLAATLTGFGLMAFEEKTYDLYTCLLFAVGILTCSSINFYPKGYTVRLGYALCYLAALSLVTTFNAFLLIALTHPVLMEQVKSFSDIKRENYQIIGNHDVFKELSRQEKVMSLSIT